MKLTDVSKTALVTLRSHVLESQKNKPIIDDPMAKYCLDNLVSFASELGGGKGTLIQQKIILSAYQSYRHQSQKIRRDNK